MLSRRGLLLTRPTTTRLSSSSTITPYVSGDRTHFGYESVRVDEKESRVKEVFASVAETYDVMNDVMSLGVHRYWKDELCDRTALRSMARAVRRGGGASLAVLDVAGGTGDVAFRLLEACGGPERSKSSGLDPISVTVCDINPSMLQVGERRARERYGDAVLDRSKGLRFVEGNAERLPFDDDTFDLYTIAFGLRNVTDVDQGLRDAYRVLKPGGRLLCLEFSQLPNPTLQSLYDAYSLHVIPAMGDLVAHDRASYQYLVESIRKFDDQARLEDRLRHAGFDGVTHTNFQQGIVALHEGWKPFRR